MINLANKILEEDFPQLLDKVEVVALIENSTAGMGAAIKKVMEDITLNLSDDDRKSYRYFTAEELEKVEIVIQRQAKIEYPNDFDMQRQTLIQEIGSYKAASNK